MFFINKPQKILDSFLVNFAKHRIESIDNKYLKEYLIISLAMISLLIENGYIKKFHDAGDNFANIRNFVSNLNENTIMDFMIVLTNYFFINTNKTILGLDTNNLAIKKLIENTERQYIDNFLLNNKEYTNFYEEMKKIILEENDSESHFKTKKFVYKKLFNNDDIVSITYFSGNITIAYNELIKENANNIKLNLLS